MSRTSPERPDGGPAPDPNRRRDRRTAWFAGAGVLVLLGALYAAAVAVAGDRIATGTRVGDVGIGGLMPAEAAARLRAELQPLAEAPIEVSVGGREAMLDPAAAGLRLDVRATVERAGGGTTLDPRALWDAFFGGDRVPPVVRADQGRLIRALRRLAERTAVTALEPMVTFDRARPVVQHPRNGSRLEVGQSAVAVRDAWLVDERTVELPLTRSRPVVGADRLRAAMRRTVPVLVSGPIELRLPGPDVRLEPQRYAPALSVRVVEGKLVAVVGEQRLTRRLARVLGSVQRPARNATVELVGGRPRVRPSRGGLQLAPPALAEAVLAAASVRKARTARVPSAATKADFSTADARDLRIDEVVSDFTTYYPHAAYRNTNIGRAAALIDGTVLRPGQTFSLNETVGERTAANGFVEGFIISNGVFAEDFGGGVSQVATTMFNAAFFAGLEDVEHKPHSFYIDRYPAGREATVAWGAVDLRFRNDTPHGVLIHSWIQPSSPGGIGAMRVEMWSTDHWDIRARASPRYDFVAPGRRVVNGPGCVATTGYSGFEIDVFRDFYRPGSDAKLHTERFHTDYIPLDTVVCR